MFPCLAEGGTGACQVREVTWMYLNRPPQKPHGKEYLPRIQYLCVMQGDGPLLVYQDNQRVPVCFDNGTESKNRQQGAVQLGAGTSMQGLYAADPRFLRSYIACLHACSIAQRHPACMQACVVTGRWPAPSSSFSPNCSEGGSSPNARGSKPLQLQLAYWGHGAAPCTGATGAPGLSSRACATAYAYVSSAAS